MSQPDCDTALQEACESWKQWAEAERRAIQAADWAALEQCQEQLLKLQPRFAAAALAARAEWTRLGAAGQQRAAWLQARVDELIALEQANAASLAKHRQHVVTQLDELDASVRRLRRVQRSYAPPRVAAWSSFS